jgi:hypothetical protein
MNFFDRLFRQNKHQDAGEKFLKYFKIEASDGMVEAVADINDRDILTYFTRIANFIQQCLRHHNIEHYLTAFCTLAGQEMEISVIRSGEKGPTKLLEDARLEIARLESVIARLEGRSNCPKQDCSV